MAEEQKRASASVNTRRLTTGELRVLSDSPIAKRLAEATRNHDRISAAQAKLENDHVEGILPTGVRPPATEVAIIGTESQIQSRLTKYKEDNKKIVDDLRSLFDLDFKE